MLPSDTPGHGQRRARHDVPGFGMTAGKQGSGKGTSPCSLEKSDRQGRL